MKSELTEIVKQQDNSGANDIDDTAETAGHTRLKTPHYHCNVNSTRVIWMQVKGYVDRHNISFQLEEIRSLLQTAAENIRAKIR